VTAPDIDCVNLGPLFEPTSIAVIGCSATHSNLGNHVLRALANRYSGRLYAVHPTASQVDNVPAYASIRDIGHVIDYAYIASAAQTIPAILRHSAGVLRFAQVAAAGFGDVGNSVLEDDLVAAARHGGIRVIGPNSVGAYCPTGALTFFDRAPSDAGVVSVVSQSGGVLMDVIALGAARGLRFSRAVSIGNGADLTSLDFMRYLGQDDSTKVVGLYIENVADGRTFLANLTRLCARKTVIVLRGGRTKAGGRAAALHTGAMATGARLWDSMCMQAGALVAQSLEQLVSMLLAAAHTCDLHSARRLQQLLLIGPGGGASVLAADAAASMGFALPAIPRRDLAPAVTSLAGTSWRNPVDLTTRAFTDHQAGSITASVMPWLKKARVGLVVVHCGLHNVAEFGTTDASRLEAMIGALGEWRDSGPVVALALRYAPDPAFDEIRDVLVGMARAQRIPVFESVDSVLRAFEPLCRRRSAGLRAGRDQGRPVDERSSATVGVQPYRPRALIKDSKS
jgi:acyl-CoA synthetase (NDP forming)